MYLFAGRTMKSKHDRRTAVHIAIQEPGADAPRSLCNGSPVAPSLTPDVTVTCLKCVASVDSLPQGLINIPRQQTRQQTALAG